MSLVQPRPPRSRPTLTVVVPMYNSAETVARTLESIRTQTFEDWRCVVVDDGSTDAGPVVVKSFMEADPRFGMISQANKGLPGARNTGLEAALSSGSRLISFVDSDDWMDPRAYEWLVPAAAETGASYAGYELCREDGSPLGRQSAVSAPVVGLDEQLEWNRTATHAHLFSAEAIGDARFDEGLRVVEDYDLWLRLAVRGERWKAVERIVCAYRIRPGSMSKRFGDMAACIERAVRKAFRLAADAGWGGRVDLSPERLERVCGGNALLYSTMEALREPAPGKPRAAALMESLARPARFEADAAALAANTALIFGLGTAPDCDGSSERAWVPALRAWWGVCETRGWLAPGGAEAALAVLSRRSVHPDAVAASILGARDVRGRAPEQGLVVVGLDRNGRRLCRRAAERGWRVLALDDGPDPREAGLLEPLPGVRVCRDPARFRAELGGGFAGAPWATGLMPPGDDAALRRAAAACTVPTPTARRWHEHRERLGEAVHALLRAAWEERPARAG